MKSREEVVASKLYDLLADSRLDSYTLGRIIAQTLSADIYDKFEEVADSAKIEKDKRIDWLKQMVIGEKTMETTIDNKAILLTHFDEEYADDEYFAEFFATENVGLPLAIFYTTNLVTGVTELGFQYIEVAFGALLNELKIKEDTGFTSLDELRQASPIW